MSIINEIIHAKILKKDPDGFYVLLENEDIWFVPDIGGNIRNKNKIDINNLDDAQEFIISYYIDETGPKGGRTKAAREAMSPEKARRKAERVHQEKFNRDELFEKFDEAYGCAYATYVEEIEKLKAGKIPCATLRSGTGLKDVKKLDKYRATPTYNRKLNTKFGKDITEWGRSRNRSKESEFEGQPKVALIDIENSPKQFALRFTNEDDLKTPCPDPKLNATRDFFECLRNQGVDVPEKNDPFTNIAQVIDGKIKPGIREVSPGVFLLCTETSCKRISKEEAEKMMKEGT